MNPTQATDARFRETQWTIVNQARSPDAKEALNQLCSIYWPPVYAFIRHNGFSPADAADLAQDFLLHVIGGDVLSQVGPEKGRFRSFLKASLSHFLSNQRDWAKAKKRGGDRVIISIDSENEEGQHTIELGQSTDPTEIFDRRWALVLTDKVLVELERRQKKSENAKVFAVLKSHLTEESEDGFYAGVADDLGLREGAVRTTMHRLRREFGRLVRHEVRQTLQSPTEQEVSDEIRHLFAALGNQAGPQL
jgi:RNA polymerase sigma-70 factor (ECF subfamily)